MFASKLEKKSVPMREGGVRAVFLNRRILALGVCSLICFALSPVTSAQETHPAITHVDQGLEDLFSQAARFERAGEYSKAAKIYLKAGDALTKRRRKNPEHRYVTRVDEKLDWGLQEAIAARIKALPAKGQEAYLLVVEPRARAALAAAEKSRRLEDLRLLADRFPLAPSSLKALRLLADWALEQGQVKLAAATYLRLARFTPQKRLSHVARAARCYALIRDQSGLEFIAGQLTDLKIKPDKELQRLLRAASGKAKSPTTAPRLAQLGRLEATGTLTRPEMTPAISAYFKTLPPYQRPVISKRGSDIFVYLADSKTVRAYRLGETLRSWWDFTVGGPNAEPERLEVMRLAPAVVGDRVFATLNRNRPAMRVRRKAGGNLAPKKTSKEKSKDPDDDFEIKQVKNWRVVILDRQTGTILKDLADNDEFERFSRNAEWISSPTVKNGFIYLSVTVFKNALRSYLLKINADSGQMIWVAELTSRTPSNHRGLAGPLSAPVIREGIAYIGTGIGLLAAVEVAHGRVIWAYHYPVFSDRSQPTIIDKNRRFAVSPIQVLKSEGLVVLAPVDGPYVIAVKRDSGQLVWKKPRANARFLDYHAGRLLLTGSRVIQLNNKSGLVHLESPRLPAVAAAPPLCGQSSMIIPTGKGFVRLSNKDLTIEKVFEVKDKQEVGPLVCLTAQRFLTITARRFNIYASKERTFQEFDRLGSFARWYERAVLYERRGDFQKSIKSFARALKTSTGKSDPERRLQASKSLFRVLWRFAEGRFKDDKGQAFSQLAKQFLKIVRKAEDMADQSGTRADTEFLLQTALFKKRFGEVLEARDNLEDAQFAVTAYQSLLDRRARLKLDHYGVKVDSKAYAADRLRALILKYSQKIYREYDALASRLGKEAIANNSNDSMIAVIARYPVSKIAAELRYQLAQYYNKRFLHSLGTEALEAFLKDYPDDPKAAKVMAQLAETLKKRNRNHDAKRVAMELLRRFQGQKITNQLGQELRVRDYVKRIIDDIETVQNPMALAWKDRCADLRKPLSRSFHLEMDLNGVGTKWLEVGPHEELQHFFLKRENTLEAHLADGGLLAWSLPNVPTFKEALGARATAGILAVPLLDEVIGVHINSGAIKWRFKPKDDGKAKNFIGLEKIVALTTDKNYVYALTRWANFVCINPLNGKVRWKSRFPNRVSRHIAARDGRAFVATNLPAGVTLVDSETGKITKRIALSNDLRSEHRGPLVVLGESVVAMVAPHQLAALSLKNNKLLYELRFPELGSIKKLFVSKDENSLYALGSQQVGDRSSLMIFNSETGISRWTDDGRGRVKGFGRKYANSTKIKQVYCGDRALYTVRREGLENTQIWAQDLKTGARQWVWRCPPGQGPQTIIETPGQLMVPYGGQLGRCSLSIIAKGAGQTIDTYRIPGRKVVSVGVAHGTLLVLTDRGQFAYSRISDDDVARDVVEMIDVLGKQKNAEPLLAALLADRLQKAGSIDPAVELLANSLLAESLDQKDFRLLYSKLVTLLEMQIEKKQPKLKIQRMSRPAEIDGELNDWWREWSSVTAKGPANVLPIQGMKGTAREFWRGQEDLSAKLYMAYDSKNLYFALDVRDQDLRPFDSEAKRWIGDCLLIAIDCKNNGGLWYNRDDILLSLALTRPRKKNKDKNCKSKKEKDAEKKKNRPMGKYFVKRKEDHSGVIYECKIPWAMFKKYGVVINEQTGPKKGFTFGFNFVLTDDDGGRRRDGKTEGARKALSWTPSLRLHVDRSRIWQGYIPEYFGKVTLD
jgi:outer membrane protein assembly factor BamB/tetratricopeptide (TPR) repeat protein